jgi:hypothetical protein
MVPQKARSFWDDLPSAARAGVYAGGLLLTLFGGVALGDGAVPQEQPSRLERLERNDARQDTTLARQTAAIDSVRAGQVQGQATLLYLQCGMKVARGKSTEDCEATFVERQLGGAR